MNENLVGENLPRLKLLWTDIPPNYSSLSYRNYFNIESLDNDLRSLWRTSCITQKIKSRYRKYSISMKYTFATIQTLLHNFTLQSMSQHTAALSQHSLKNLDLLQDACPTSTTLG